jgi:chromatin assembly factor 1 subunit B
MIVDDEVSPSSGVRPKFLYEIAGAHTNTVNIVRFSPNGMYLATGGDDAAIVIWTQKLRPVQFGSNVEKVLWSCHKILRGHLSDIYDLAWSPDSKHIVTGSVDNSAKIWNIEKSKTIENYNHHSHFVQGVSWDPKNKYVVTQSSDRSVRVYKNAENKQNLRFFPQNQLKRYQADGVDDKMLYDELNKKDNKILFNNYFADEMQCPS